MTTRVPLFLRPARRVSYSPTPCFDQAARRLIQVDPVEIEASSLSILPW